MFIPHFFPFISMIDDVADNGGGGDEQQQEVNLGLEEIHTQDNQEQQQEEVKIDPNWQSILDQIPPEFHERVLLPKFKEWDQNFAKVQSDYAPYKPLLENNVPFDNIQKAFQLAELLNSNPKAVYDELGNRFGFNSGQGQQQVEDNEEQEDQQDIGNPNAQFDITKHPQFVELQNVVNQLTSGLSAQQQAVQNQQEEARVQQEINTEFATLESRVGKLPDNIKAEIMSRAVRIGDARGDGNFFIEDGYKDYVQFANFIRNSRANNTAPDVMPGNGGMPQQKMKYGEMSDEQRVDAWAEMARKIAEGNQ